MQRGDRVLAWWSAEVEWWYAGTIVNVAGGTIEVQFDDTARDDLGPDQVRSLTLSVGDRVFVRWRGGEIYYPGRIAEVQGAAAFVQYDDGDTEWVSPAALRVHRNDL